MLLSKEAPKTMSEAAFSTSAVSSTTTGGLPGPAQMARLPLDMAALTTAPPPVTTITRMFGCFMSCPADSMVGSATHTTVLGGPPAATMALLSKAMVWMEHCLAEGCTLKTTTLPAASMPMALQMMVEVGLVVGVMAPMMP